MQRRIREHGIKRFSQVKVGCICNFKSQVWIVLPSLFNHRWCFVNANCDRTTCRNLLRQLPGSTS